MTRPAVINASPLIFLARSRQVDLLRLIAEEVVVPESVAAEIRRRAPTDPTVQAIEGNPWLRVVGVSDVPAIIQAWDLGPGESAVLACAHATAGMEAIIDDLSGRRCAAALGIPVRGTLGIVLLAKRRGRIAAARPLVEQMRSSGMFLSDRVMNEALALVDE